MTLDILFFLKKKCKVLHIFAIDICKGKLTNSESEILIKNCLTKIVLRSYEKPCAKYFCSNKNF